MTRRDRFSRLVDSCQRFENESILFTNARENRLIVVRNEAEEQRFDQFVMSPMTTEKDVSIRIAHVLSIDRQREIFFLKQNNDQADDERTKETRTAVAKYVEFGENSMN
jgi:hypothetical protein